MFRNQANENNIPRTKEPQAIVGVVPFTVIDSSELDTIEKANQAKNSTNGKVKAAEKKRQATLTLGKVAWNQMFEDDVFEL